eukprot:6652056-Pyramimonas_sp.AAC.1
MRSGIVVLSWELAPAVVSLCFPSSCIRLVQVLWLIMLFWRFVWSLLLYLLLAALVVHGLGWSRWWWRRSGGLRRAQPAALVLAEDVVHLAGHADARPP